MGGLLPPLACPYFVALRADFFKFFVSVGAGATETKKEKRIFLVASFAYFLWK
jgi:hypothetical protein